MSHVLFVDPVAPRTYDPRAFYDRALGPTETNVLRVAEGLAQRGHRVTVAQRGRSWPERSAGGVRYVPSDAATRVRPASTDAIVVVGQSRHLPLLRQSAPAARLALWLHTGPGARQQALAQTVVSTSATILAVSETHRAEIAAFVHGSADGGRRGPAWAPVACLHPPIDDTLAPDGAAVQPDKLVAFAGGSLSATLAAFEAVRQRRPAARLRVVGDRSDEVEREGVVWHGDVPHREALRHVREAFAVLGPLGSEAPSFSLSVAEANAVGTPAVAHAHPGLCETLGETLHDGRQVVDARRPEAVAERLEAWWAEGRPEVAGLSAFRLGTVLKEWERLLGLEVRRDRQAPAVSRTRPALRPAVPA